MSDKRADCTKAAFDASVERARNAMQTASEFEVCGILWYFVRNHIPKRIFCEALRLEFEVEIGAAQVEHCYIRNVPAGADMPGCMRFIRSKPGRGAYPVTLFDVDWIANWTTIDEGLNALTTDTMPL